MKSLVGSITYFMESVYGDRTRSHDENHVAQLAAAITDIEKRGGTLLIPAFSTQRTPDIIFEIKNLMAENKVPHMPVYIDSPLAEKVTAAYLQYPQYFSDAIQREIAAGEHLFSFPELHFLLKMPTVLEPYHHHVEPKIIIAGSGMSNGGRVHGHEKAILPDKNSTRLIAGHQAAGSLGRRLLEGEKNVLITGEKVQVQAKVESDLAVTLHTWMALRYLSLQERLLTRLNKYSSG